MKEREESEEKILRNAEKGSEKPEETLFPPDEREAEAAEKIEKMMFQSAEKGQEKREKAAFLPDGKKLETTDETMLRIAGVADESIVDGPGIRYVVFVQGCPHRCEGCHNEQTHDFDGGVDVPVSELLSEIDADPIISGVTFSGGEPFCQAAELCVMADEVKRRHKNLMVYSGYTYEELTEMAEQDSFVRHLLETADSLVDGRFVLAERDLELSFRGSRNQRYIDLVQTRRQGRIVLADEQGKWV